MREFFTIQVLLIAVAAVAVYLVLRKIGKGDDED